MSGARLCWQVSEKQGSGLLVGELHWFLSADRSEISQALGETFPSIWDLDMKPQPNTWCGGHCRSMLNDGAHFLLWR